MQYRIVSFYLFIIFTTMAVAFTACGLVSLYYPTKIELQADVSWAFCLAITVGISFIFYILGRGHTTHLFRREALCVIGLGWIGCCILGTLPYWLIVPEMSIMDAIFESTSGLTTTGASVINSVEELPPSLLFWRALSQWIGGLGVVVFFVALLSFIGAGAKILYSHESSGHSTDLESSRIQQGVFKILLIYLALSVLCAMVFMIEGMTPFDAICHMFTTVSTAGFSTKSNSMAFFKSPAIEWTSIIFMIIGGTSFLLMMAALNGRINTLLKNTEFRTYIYMLILFSLLTGLVIHAEYESVTIAESIRYGVFQVTSIMTTSGFSTIDYNLAAPAAHIFLMILMITGACSGSTAGGLKLIRIISGAKIIYHHIERTFRPRIVRTVHIDDKPLSSMAHEAIMTHISVFLFITIVSMFIISLFERNLSFEGNFSATIACLLNIGPGFAEVGPAETYSFLSGTTKVYLAFLMILGRLEFFAILVLFNPSFWRRFN